MAIADTTERCGNLTLPVNPFVSNQYHFGMLLGVADLETEQAYHRGKTWMHNAWLHGPGAVWGLEVTTRPDNNEVAVAPGMALDGHGRELLVSDTMCVDIARWFNERRPDDLEVEEIDGVSIFTVHVELCHDSCLDRPVPSISEPCDDASLDTAYSRAVERGLPRIVGGSVPAPSPAPYPRLREFFGLAPAADELVLAVQADVDAATADDPATRPAALATAFQTLAAADTMALGPEEGASLWSPTAGDGCVVLAELVIHLQDPEGTPRLLVAEPDADPQTTTVDNFVRQSHVRTMSAQQLLLNSLT